MYGSRSSAASSRRLSRRSTLLRPRSIGRLAGVVGVAWILLAVPGVAAAASFQAQNAGRQGRTAHARGPRTQHALPDLVIQHAALKINPAYRPGAPLLIATLDVANVGKGIARFTPHQIYVKVSESVPGGTSWGATAAMPVQSLAPGAKRSLSLKIFPYKHFFPPHGSCGKHSLFFFAVNPPGEGPPLRESHIDNNRIGPIAVTVPLKDCAGPSPAHSDAPLNLNGIGPLPSPPPNVGLEPTRGQSAKNRARTRSPVESLRAAPSGLHLPLGWSARDGILQADHAGLRLALAGGRSLLCKRSANGQLGYTLMLTSGRVIKQISSGERLRVLAGGLIMLEETNSRHRQALLGRLATAADR